MKQNQKNGDTSNAGSKLGSPTGKRTYSAPKILSVERLEAAAATCTPNTGALGKAFDIGPPIICAALGS